MESCLYKQLEQPLMGERTKAICFRTFGKLGLIGVGRQLCSASPTSERTLTHGATAGLYEQTGHDDLVRRYVFVAGAGRLCLKLSRRRRLGVLRRLVL